MSSEHGHSLGPPSASVAAANGSQALSVNSQALSVNSQALSVNSQALSGNSQALSVNSQASPVNSNALPVKRGRRSNPKVKTGCTNCKQRRIKCDEKRPACTQCLRSNRPCTGYPPPGRSDGPVAEVRIAPKPVVALLQRQPGLLQRPTILPPRRQRKRLLHVAGASLSVHQPSIALSLHHAEALYFDLFRLQTASELSGYFNSSFWGHRVLQECHSEVAIRHAVIALGALYKTLEQSSQPALPAGSVANLNRINSIRSHWQVAVKQYSEACNAMLLLHGENLLHHRTRLMASVLLSCFDSFIGDHKQAIVQIQTGLGLLERLHHSHPHYQSPSPAGYIEEDLVVIFVRLAIQAKSYDMAFHFPQPYVIRLAAQGQRAEGTPTSETTSPGSSLPEAPIPYRFGSIMEARLASDKLCEKLLRFIERLQIAKNDPSNVLPASWKQYGLSFKHQLDSWTEAFEPIFRSRLDPGVGHLEKSGISALKMFQINTNILFMMMFCDTEVQFDAFLPHFKAVVKLGWEVVGAQERRAVAQPCPNPSMCQHPGASRAIQLLRSSARREGMWDSELAANIGEWIMQVEEFDDQVAPGTVPTRPIPEEKRVMVKTVDFDLRARFADVRVGTRALYDGCPDDRFRKTRLTW
ncbi:C6 zinc finger domain protein [Ophiocordyceps sinensis CO18]|uniref:C6 zinc finger domain protein n=1 Tax=Ophiocordyceps sinensis (strain Co18 / CGMCC 3.14243) TaxID=911162 RepID=T5A7K8_OPHSC|nr:C6 zinc finger domain protein [Ophiocordyceps sinensis CO18]